MIVKTAKTKNKGFVLATSLVLFSVLFVLATSYVVSVQYDAKFFRIQETRMQALLLARSGIQYYISIEQPKPISAKDQNFYLNENKKIELEIINFQGKKFLKSTGVLLYSGGKEKIRKSVAAPLTDLKNWTEL